MKILRPPVLVAILLDIVINLYLAYDDQLHQRAILMMYGIFLAFFMTVLYLIVLMSKPRRQ